MPLGGIGVHGHSVVTTYLFTDVEGSTRLWEQESQRMPEALACQNAQGPTPGLARCKALWVAGQISSVMARYDEAPLYLHESLQLARALGDSRMVVSVLNTLTLAALGQGNAAAARVHCEEALDLANGLGDKRQIAVSSNSLAQIYRLQGELDAAEPLRRTGRAVTDGRRAASQQYDARHHCQQGRSRFHGLLPISWKSLKRVETPCASRTVRPMSRSAQPPLPCTYSDNVRIPSDTCSWILKLAATPGIVATSDRRCKNGRRYV